MDFAPQTTQPRWIFNFECGESSRFRCVPTSVPVPRDMPRLCADVPPQTIRRHTATGAGLGVEMVNRGPGLIQFAQVGSGFMRKATGRRHCKDASGSRVKRLSS